METRSSISERDKDIIRRFMEVRTADIVDTLGRYNVHGLTLMHEGIRPLFNDIKMAGVALTIRLTKVRETIPTMSPEDYERYASDWYRSRNNAELFLKVAEPGHVLVADAGLYPGRLLGLMHRFGR